MAEETEVDQGHQGQQALRCAAAAAAEHPLFATLLAYLLAAFPSSGVVAATVAFLAPGVVDTRHAD